MASQPKPRSRGRKTLVELSNRGTLTLPRQLRTSSTSLYEARQRDDGTIELIPQQAVDAAQAWFWTERWQEMERDAQADIKAGRVRRYKGVASLLTDLDRS
jgi:antitoxin MazE